jgi:hypothetical protein
MNIFYIIKYKYYINITLMIYIQYFYYSNKMPLIKHKTPLNKTLNELIKEVLNYEDKEFDINTILLSIQFPESLSDFDENAFKSDIKYAYKCIKKFKSKNKKNSITQCIEEIEKYVLSNLNDFHLKKPEYIATKVEDIETLDKDFFNSLNFILNIELDSQIQESIAYFIKKIFDTEEYKYILEIFDTNANILSIIKKIIIKQNLYDEIDFVKSLYIIIELISKNTDLSNYLRIFLSYDLEKEVSFIVNNTENLLKYVSIINKNNKNTILNETLKNHIRYIILYIQNKHNL